MDIRRLSFVQQFDRLAHWRNLVLTMQAQPCGGYVTFQETRGGGKTNSKYPKLGRTRNLLLERVIYTLSQGGAQKCLE